MIPEELRLLSSARDLQCRGIRVTVACMGKSAEFRDRSAFGAFEPSLCGMGLDYDLEALEHYIRSEHVNVVSRHDTLLGAGFIKEIGVPQCFVIHDTAFW